MQFDTNQEEKELAGLNAELEQIQASLEQDFASYATANTTAEDEELFFDNREEFYKKLLQKQNAFFEEKIGSKKTRVGELEQSIQNKKTLGAIEEAKNEFLKANPEANIQELMAFFDEDLTKRETNEMESLPPLEFFNKVYELYKQRKGEGDKGEELPFKLEGASGNVENSSGYENPLSRY